jgi:hypothetical protein
VVASLFVALNAIYVKKILPIVDGDSWKYARAPLLISHRQAAAAQ